MVPTTYRVIYGDTDQMGVVYYGNYLRFAEHGRNEFIRARGLRYRDVERQHEMHLPVAEAHIAYKQSARYDDLLRIETTLSEIRRASLRFSYRILRDEDGALIAEGHTLHACVGLDGRPKKLPEDVVHSLRHGTASAR